MKLLVVVWPRVQWLCKFSPSWGPPGPNGSLSLLNPISSCIGLSLSVPSLFLFFFLFPFLLLLRLTLPPSLSLSLPPSLSPIIPFPHPSPCPSFAVSTSRLLPRLHSDLSSICPLPLASTPTTISTVVSPSPPPASDSLHCLSLHPPPTPPPLPPRLLPPLSTPSPPPPLLLLPPPPRQVPLRNSTNTTIIPRNIPPPIPCVAPKVSVIPAREATTAATTRRYGQRPLHPSSMLTLSISRGRCHPSHCNPSSQNLANPVAVSSRFTRQQPRATSPEYCSAAGRSRKSPRVAHPNNSDRYPSIPRPNAAREPLGRESMN